MTQISYDELKIHPLFKGDEAPFGAMEQAELITIIQKHGKATRPALVSMPSYSLKIQ